MCGLVVFLPVLPAKHKNAAVNLPCIRNIFASFAALLMS
jgi:hypothetical protein